MTTTHITVGATNDREILERQIDGGPSQNWPLPKAAQIGDEVLFLIPSQHGEIQARGIVEALPFNENWGNRPQYFAPVGQVVGLITPVPVRSLAQEFPEWGWPRYARSYTTVPSVYL
jgi:hypothetical protein